MDYSMTNIESDKQNRRDFIKYAGGAAVGLGIGGLGFLSSNGNLAEERDKNSQLQTDISDLNDKLEDLQRWSIFGGGSNIKNMPNIVDRQPTVEMNETFYFDQKNAFCRVDNNPEAFIMPTYLMGEVPIEANTFFMLMSTSTLHVKSIDESENSTCILESDSGDCFTEASAGGNIYGSRVKPEPFKSEIVAVDGKAFSYTAYFDENEAPINFAIFGPKFTFTGELTIGSVTVKRVEQLAKSLPK